MKLIWFAIITLLIVSSLAAQDNKSNKDLILGAWEMITDDDTLFVYFQENDSVDFVQGVQAYKGKFRFLSDTTLLLGIRTWIVIKLSETEMVLSDSEWNNPDDYDYYKRSERVIEPINKYIDVVFYYDNGQKKTEGKLLDGFQHGLWREWYENGQMKSESNFLYGGPAGVF